MATRPLAPQYSSHCSSLPSGKEVGVTLDGHARFGEDSRKLLPEIAIGEVDAAHAAREYSTACSISSGDRS